jgi:hypothetical protein
LTPIPPEEGFKEQLFNELTGFFKELNTTKDHKVLPEVTQRQINSKTLA